MPRKQKSKNNNSEDTFSSDHFLRSINIEFDAEYPERIEHFFPTTKSIRLLKAILGKEQERSFFIIAPYGSGKSLTATYALHLIENRGISSEILGTIGSRLLKADKELGEFALRRKREKGRGLVIPLHGYCSNISESLKASTLQAMGRHKLGRESRPLEEIPCSTIEEAIDFLRMVKKIAQSKKLDRIAIVWDEFGRNIEKLLSDGQSSRLNEVQLLAEFASRVKNLPIVISLIMHQGLLNYASNVPQSIRSEWVKIEGRFRSLQYVDDSKEIYQLISEVVSHRRDSSALTKKELKDLTDETAGLKIFKDFKKGEIKVLVENSYPIHPITLYLLPRISARVAQNERTLFSFLYSRDFKKTIYPHELYDYFSNDMRVDTTTGGTYKQWLETQSALSKTEGDETSEIILKTTCLLGLGTVGERSKAGRDLLLYSLKGIDQSKNLEVAVDKLIEKKLLLYRRHNDEVSVWHGTDLDLRGRLAEEKNRTKDQFDLVAFLAKEVPPKVWYPVEYNSDFNIRRYLTGEYQLLPEFLKYLRFEGVVKDLPAAEDGKIVYLISEDRDDIKEAMSAAKESQALDRLVFVVPNEPLPISEAAHEIWCLENMRTDSKLIGIDPLVSQEIQQMIDDAWGHLQKLLDRLLRPNKGGSNWFNKGEEMKVHSSSDLRRSLSRVMADVYPLTPKLNNEVIVRKRPTQVMVNARKKLLMAILERSGQNDLGLEGFWADVSLYRTILLNTGMYKNFSSERWGYASPEDIQDNGLKAVWKLMSDFFTVPRPSKNPKQLFNEMMKPPFGIRAGVIPILFAAGLKAFPSAISITRDGEYITDIVPSEIEQLCRQPDRYRIIVLDLKKNEQTYLKEIYNLFGAIENNEVASTDLIRLCFDALDAWKNQLPKAAFVTEDISKETLKFQKLLQGTCDPVQLIFTEIPDLLNVNRSQVDKLIMGIREMKNELELVVSKYRKSAMNSLQRVLGFVGSKSEGNLVLAKKWASCFSESFIDKLNDGVAKGLITRLMIDYEDDKALLESLSSLLVGKSFSRWDDATVAQFDRELTDVVHRVEETALCSQEDLGNNSLASTGLENLISGRIRELFGRLIKVVGEEEAGKIVAKIKDSHALNQKK